MRLAMDASSVVALLMSRSAASNGTGDEAGDSHVARMSARVDCAVVGEEASSASAASAARRGAAPPRSFPAAGSAFGRERLLRFVGPATTTAVLTPKIIWRAMKVPSR
jgi:hypothetical protein